MIMKRVYGLHICFVCGKVPRSGWLYLCQQDAELGHEPLPPKNPIDRLAIYHQTTSYFDFLAGLAGALNMSPSVVHGIRMGDYSQDQVKLLMAQKEHVLAVIRQAESLSAKASPMKSALKSHDSSHNIIAQAGAAQALPVSSVATSRLPMTPAGQSCFMSEGGRQEHKTRRILPHVSHTP